MYPLTVAALLLALMTSMAYQTSEEIKANAILREWLDYERVRDVAHSVEEYMAQYGDYPEDLAQLAATPGYEPVAAMLNQTSAAVTYRLAPELGDGKWKYSRALVYQIERARGMTDDSFLATNTCVAAGATMRRFDVAASWCGGDGGAWYRTESRDLVLGALNTQRRRLRTTLDKFAAVYSTVGRFPGMVEFTQNPLRSGSTTALTALTAYQGTAADCRGMHEWQGVPLGCEDLFDVWGNPIGLSFTSGQAVALLSESPIVLVATGEKLFVAAGFYL